MLENSLSYMNVILDEKINSGINYICRRPLEVPTLWYVYLEYQYNMKLIELKLWLNLHAWKLSIQNSIDIKNVTIYAFALIALKIVLKSCS